MNEQLSDQILEKIDARKITPLPRWRFLLLRVSFWILAVFSVIIGSLAIGAMFFILIDFYLNGFWTVSHEVTELLLIVPYVWVIVFILFIIISQISVRHIGKGYRYRLLTIVSTNIILSVIFGSILTYAGVGKMVHQYLNNIPLYSSAIYDSKDAWDRPVIGRLSGIVVSVVDGNNFSIMDWNKHIWGVSLATPIIGSFTPEIDSTVRMFGLLDSASSVFVANSIYEWEQ